MHVPAVPDFLGILIWTYELHGLISRPRSLLRHVCSSARSYTDFLCLVAVAAERKRGASVPGQRKCGQAGRPIVNVTLENRLSKAVTRNRAPHQRSREGLPRVLLSRVTCISPLAASQSPCCNPQGIYYITFHYLRTSSEPTPYTVSNNRRQCATVRVPASFDMLVLVIGQKEQCGRNQTKLQTLSYNCSTNIVESLGTVFLSQHEWSWR